jgi:hypothetical protein
LPAGLTRRIGVGDLGLRAMPRLARTAQRLVTSRAMDAVYITTYPVYHALVGPWLRRTTGARFVLDLQDPWVSAWGAEVGPRADGTADLKSRASRALATRIERLVLPHADAITGVSSELLSDLSRRYPMLAARPQAVMPIGVTPDDVAWAARQDVQHDPAALHLVYAGTLLPLGHGTVRALFDAVSIAAQSAAGAPLALRFVGTSNQAVEAAAPRALPLAAACGVEQMVSEHAPRVPFFDALRAMRAADVVLLLGTSEARYTASKLATALLAGRPILAIFHADSDVARTLRPLARQDPGVAMIEYSDERPVPATVPDIADVLRRWRECKPPAPSVAKAALEPFLAPQLAAQLVGVLDAVTAAAHV